jgi:His-Xaa-Ser system protein (TIGR03982 family)
LKFFFRIAIILIAIKLVILPVVVGLYYYYPFQKLVIACDTAMEDSWFYGSEVLKESEQVQLLACHDYDKARKIMLMSGLPENYLSFLGLKALELYQRPAEEMARQHRFIVR